MPLLSEDALEAHLMLDEMPRDAIVQMDAVELLSWLPDASIDLVVTDSAYESLEKHRAKGTTTRLKESKSSSNAWFPIFHDERYDPLFAEMYRVMKPRTHAYFFCDETTCDVLRAVAREHGFWAWKSIVWVKTVKTSAALWRLLFDAIEQLKVEFQADSDRRFPAGRISKNLERILRWKDGQGVINQMHIRRALESIVPAHAMNALTRTGMGYHWRGSCERILMLEKRSTRQSWPRLDPTGKGRKLNNLSAKDVLFGAPVLGKSAYPTEKPISVVKQLIANSSVQGEVVLDMFAGSGVTGEAAHSLDRHYICGDIDDAAIEVMVERLGPEQ